MTFEKRTYRDIYTNTNYDVLADPDLATIMDIEDIRYITENMFNIEKMLVPNLLENMLAYVN